MKYFTYNLFLGLILFGLGCSLSENVASKSSDEVTSEEKVEKRISLNINEAVYFEFVKVDSVWTGKLTTYTLNEADEKVVDRAFVSARDSSWQDFDEFVNFLKIMKIPPQYEIDGWVPDSGQLPRRVYSFEIFDGDTTRSFSYQDPVNDLLDFWESQNVLTFVTFVQNDLGWIESGNIE